MLSAFSALSAFSVFSVFSVFQCLSACSVAAIAEQALMQSISSVLHTVGGSGFTFACTKPVWATDALEIKNSYIPKTMFSTKVSSKVAVYLARLSGFG